MAENMPDLGLGIQPSDLGAPSQAKLLRRLLEDATAASGDKTVPFLNASCEALVNIANPGDAYSAFSASWNATAIAGHIKAIEARFGLKVRALSSTMVPQEMMKTLLCEQFRSLVRRSA